MDQDFCVEVAFLDRLVDEVGENESHPLASLMEIVWVLIERHEDCHILELTESMILRVNHQ